MPNTPAPPSGKQPDRRAMTGGDAPGPQPGDGEDEPKGTPSSDRYRAETAHSRAAGGPDRGKPKTS